MRNVRTAALLLTLSVIQAWADTMTSQTQVFLIGDETPLLTTGIP